MSEKESFWNQLGLFFAPDELPRLVAFGLAALGLVCIFLSVFDPRDIKALAIDVRNPIGIPQLVLGFLLVIASLSLAVTLSHWPRGLGIVTRDDGYEIPLGKTTLLITFGDISQASVVAKADALVVPANEHFDPDCFYDPHSSLAAYASANYPGGTQALKNSVENALSSMENEMRPLRSGGTVRCYGVGTIVPIENGNRTVYVLATSTRYPGGVIFADIAGLVCSVSALCDRIARDTKQHVILPLLGAGKAGISSSESVALIALLLRQYFSQASGFHPRIVELVIFERPDSDKKARRANRANTLRALRLALSLSRT